MSIGERIVEQRKKLGMTRVQLAQDLDIPHTTLRNYETDQREPGHLMLIKLSQKFGVTTDYLLCVNDDDCEENKKSPEPKGSEDDRISVDEMKIVLRRLGYLSDGRDLTDKDVQFVSGIFDLLDVWFG